MTKLFYYVAIPAIDFERAFKFYSVITNGSIHKNPSVSFPMAYFVDKEGHNVGHLFQHSNFKPSIDGPIIYLEPKKDLDETLWKIPSAGGKIIMNKTLIAPGNGYWALFLDSEGNRLALHSEE